MNAFQRIRRAGLTLPDVVEATRYDGSKVLKVADRFMAGLASHPSAEPESLVVRIDPHERDWLLEDAPETYYVTDSYRPHPVVLARLSRLDDDSLRDLLSLSRRVTLARGRRRRAGGKATSSRSGGHL